jgi:GntR family transcriptional regulator, transcriptional repressor for pyruvate dehydrogenase complex
MLTGQTSWLDGRSTVFVKVKSKKVYMEIVDQILTLIKEKKLSVGEKLPAERSLAIELGVSRPPLREAISALEILGIVESRGGKGNFIVNSKIEAEKTRLARDLEEQVSPFELLEARQAVETEMAGLAAEKATDEDLADLEAIIERHKTVLSDFSVASEVDLEFHLALVKITRNAVLLDIFERNIASVLRTELWKKIKRESWSRGDNSRKYFAEHIEIYEAVRRRDKGGARAAMMKHLRSIKDDFLEDLE